MTTSSSTLSSNVPHAESIGHGMLLNWMDEVRAAARSSPSANLLNVDGVDVLDVLASPIYLALLNSMRAGSPSSTPIIGRLRHWGYRLKMALEEHRAAGKSAPAGETDILLWTRDITHTNTLHPVAQAIEAEAGRCRTLACQSKVFSGIRRCDPNAVYTLGCWPRAVRAARRQGALHSRRLTALGPWNPDAFPAPPAPGLLEVVRQTVTQYLPLACEAVVNAQMALDAFKPRVLVVGNDLTVEGRAGCRVAASRGVPTAMFMHGNITASALQTLHCADRLLVYGELHRDDLVQQGIAPARIVVCGAPNLDHRKQQSGQVHPLLQSRLGLRTNDPWILVATSGPGHLISHRHHALVIEHLVRLSMAFPKVPVVVKLHRKDRLRYYQQGLKDCAASKLIVVAEDSPGFPGDIFEWLEGCRVVLTGASTVAVEAMLMNVPVITMDFCHEIHAVDFIEAGATTHVSTSPALVEAVQAIVSGQGPGAEVQAHVQAYLKKAFYALDGLSASRGAQSLMEMNPR